MERSSSFEDFSARQEIKKIYPKEDQELARLKKEIPKLEMELADLRALKTEEFTSENILRKTELSKALEDVKARANELEAKSHDFGLENIG